LEETLRSSTADGKRFWIFTGPLSIVTVLLLIAGLAVTGKEWVPLTWLVTSMSGFWIVNRLLHGISGTAGETERDGVVWLLPLATGFLPCLALLTLKTPIYQAYAVIAWSLVPTVLILTLRPEIDHEVFELKHLERAGLFPAMRSLFKYRMGVCELKPGVPFTSARRAAAPRLTVSCLIYYIGFAITGATLIAVTPILERMTPDQAKGVFPVWVTVTGAGIFALLAAFVAGLAITYREGKIGWKIQEKERQILAIVYFLSTANVAVTLVVAVVLPLLVKVTTA
jgi:hypothetical protein